MNQQTVVDAIPIDLFTIERSTLEQEMWIVWGHGDDDFVQLFDTYNTCLLYTSPSPRD